MGNRLPRPQPAVKLMPVDTPFKLPSTLPSWPPGSGFGTGTIALGGLELRQVSTFSKVWASHEGGPNNTGATFFTPSSIPSGFYALGAYSQPNNQPLFGWVLVAKDNDGSILAKPLNFSLISKRVQDNNSAYFWRPVPPEGYKAIGHLVTNTADKPSTDNVCETDSLVWSTRKAANNNGLSVYSLRPKERGSNALGICVGTFVATVASTPDADVASLACLKNKGYVLDSMPNHAQIESLLKAYSPFMFFHPDEMYLPSSVPWLFTNGALLYKKGDPNPIQIDPNGSNLPQDGSNDGSYWIDLPTNNDAADKVKRGDLGSAESYLHVKPMLGATFTDIAIWVVYPFNGPVKLKVQLINVPLGKIGEHVGYWEHLTLRISNFTGELWRVYYAEHSGGQWMNASELEFQQGNKATVYSSLHGHASYSKAGLVLQGNTKLDIGIRNDSAKSKFVMDTGAKFTIIAAEYLDSIAQPPWLNYTREWGPKVSFDTTNELKKVEKFLLKKLRNAVEDIVRSLPKEVLGEEGPTGPKMKNNWTTDEV
ncbi:hypothetical protein AMTR_s00068p00125530 [Amborella trichopoda]|uniref:Uncharacterized protein n=1 Tax=Amborella trichopoda TaxID=13333 RepID=U5DIN9_AMBTC|nr:hypothetical protein AMTR_s00068p00125530 [Amborella trichopoda]